MNYLIIFLKNMNLIFLKKKEIFQKKEIKIYLNSIEIYEKSLLNKIKKIDYIYIKIGVKN